YIYNQNQRLIKAVENGNILGEYKYNGNGQRVKKTVDGAITYYIYDQSGNLIEEADKDGQVNIDYVYLGSVPIARADEWWEGMQLPQEPTRLNLIPGDKQLTVGWNANAGLVDGYKVYWGTSSGQYTNSTDVGKTTTYTITGLTNGTTYYIAVKAYADLKETYFYHVDHLGTPILMTSGSGTIVWAADMLPFGERYSVNGSVTNNLGFSGQYSDVETGLYYNWWRYYIDKLGRYNSFDPILHPANAPPFNSNFSDFLLVPAKLNPFVYTQNNPIIFSDPSGKNVYSCVRPMNGVPSFVYDYLGVGHEYLWVDSMNGGVGAGYGLAPKEGYRALALLSPVPGYIEEEAVRNGNCFEVTHDKCEEEKISQIIQAERRKSHVYDLRLHNCYHWVDSVLRRSNE
ncbi:MAG: RHS repeat-associated core domain-containing protein, partial [Planctomycetota bacterium]